MAHCRFHQSTHNYYSTSAYGMRIAVRGFGPFTDMSETLCPDLVDCRRTLALGPDAAFCMDDQGSHIHKPGVERIWLVARTVTSNRPTTPSTEDLARVGVVKVGDLEKRILCGLRD